MPESKLPVTDEEIILVNIMEELVKLQVKETLKDLGACECQTCYLNACALALNDLKPKYVTTRKGALFSKITEMERANSVNILFAVTKAVKQVQECPHH
jgi:competence protein ComFB